MIASELREKSIDELANLLVELRREQFNLRMQRGMSEMPRPHQFKRVRRDIARVLTIMTAKNRSAANV